MNKIHVEILNHDNDNNFIVVFSIDNQEIRRNFPTYQKAHDFVEAIKQASQEAFWK